MVTAYGRIVSIRKAATSGKVRTLTEGLVWFEVYLPFSPEKFAALQALAQLHTVEGQALNFAAAKLADPELYRLAAEPLDSHGEVMLAADLQQLAHVFLIESRKIDVMHDEVDRATVALVESFLNVEEVASPHYFPGAWVVVLRVAAGSEEWRKIEAGELNAVSFGATVTKIPIVIKTPATPEAA